MGAMKVARCFSAASMKIVKANIPVRNISMNRPRATDVSSARVVATANFWHCQRDGRHGRARKTHVREQGRNDSCAGDGANDLRNQDHGSARPAQATDEHEAESDGWVEEAAADAEEDPSIDCQAKSECQRDIQQSSDRWRLLASRIRRFIGDLGACKSEEEEEESA